MPDADRLPRRTRDADGEDVVIGRGASDMKAGNVVAQHLFEAIHCEGLFDIAAHGTDGECLFQIGRTVAGGEHDDRGGAVGQQLLALADMQEFEAVHTWHVDVHEHEVGQVVGRSHEIQGLLGGGVAGQSTDEAGLLQHQLGHEVAIILVVDEQDMGDGERGFRDHVVPADALNGAAR